MGVKKQITVGGVIYPSLGEAAAALGMSLTTLAKRIEKGVDPTAPVKRYECGRRKRPQRRTVLSYEKKLKGPAQQPVMVDGRMFPSTFDAAAHLGVSVQYVYQAISSGRPIHGHDVRRAEQIDIVLNEIESNNKKPYQFSR